MITGSFGQHRLLVRNVEALLPSSVNDHSFKEGLRLLRQGRFLELLASLPELDPLDRRYVPVALLRLRTLLAQGRVGEAASEGAAQSSPGSAGEDANRLQLWRYLAVLYGPTALESGDSLSALDGACRGVLASTEATPSLRALAQDFIVRGRLFRNALDGDPPARRADTAAAFNLIADAYTAVGQTVEALEARRREAGLLRHPLGGNRQRARALFQGAANDAAAAGAHIEAAEARLALAEMELEDCLDRVPDGCDPDSVLPKFNEVERLYAEGGHAFGEAIVNWSLARILLRYGLEPGVELARKAALGFAAAGALTSERDVWSDLFTWHTRRGEPREAHHALGESRRIAAAMGPWIGTGMEWLAQADQAFRLGHAAEARRVLTRELARLPSIVQRVSHRIILSNTIGSVGLRAEARRLLEEAVAELESQEPTVLLGEALLLLATQYTKESLDASIAYATHAIGVAQGIGAHVEEGKYLSFRGSQLVLKAHLAGMHQVSSEAAADFDAAEALLGQALTLESRVELITLYEHRGQAGLFFRDWAACGHWLSQAEQVAHAYGLIHTLAFVFVQQGLALLQLARTEGLERYDQAAERFDLALESFEQSGTRGMRWHGLFYRALCDKEGGEWEDPEKSRRDERWDRARRLLEDAAQEIDRLRGFSDEGAMAQRQTVTISFSVDKQQLYATGFDLAWRLRRDAVDALRWLERMKGRALLDALAHTALPSEIRSDHPLLARELELLERKQGASDALEAVAIQDEMDHLLVEMTADSQTAGYAALRRVAPPDWQELRGALAREQHELDGRKLVIAQFAVLPGETLLFGMRADWDAPRVERIALNRKSFEDFARAHFRTPGGVRMLMDDLGEDGERAWARFAPLLAPLAAWADRDDVVCLVPHEILHDLPLHTLPVEGEPLVLRNPVFYAPSSSLLRHTLRRDTWHRDGQDAVAVFGDSRNDLPRSRAEAIAVAAMLAGELRIGDEVTRDSMLNALASARLMHFAGHGRLSAADGFDTGLQLAGNEILRAVDLLASVTVSELVVLSGCETGVHERRPGDELAGLVRALLVAGARTVLVSQWRVHDASTETLLTTFHQRRLKDGLGSAEALRHAVRQVQNTPGTAHLYHWGGFVLVGTWR